MSFVAAIARNKRKTAILVAYVLVTVAVVAWRASHYRSAPTWLVPVARGSAAGVYLNFALVLLPMLRLTLSRPWMWPLGLVLPLHKAIEAHTIAGWAVIGFSAVHVAAYAGIAATDAALLRQVGTPLVLATGVALTGLLGALAVGAWRRERGQFEGFYFTHFLTVPIGLLSMLHAPWFLALTAVPLALFLVDRLLRVAWMARPARVASVDVDGRDLDLVVERPAAFAYRSGDYAFLCVPAVSRVQWHPFSLINAPSDDGALRFRIRRAGAWTEALAHVSPGARVYVDGPFGTPCRDLHACARPIVVAGGIGITPFVSFLEEVRATGRVPFERMHVVWVERDEASFSRFAPLLDALERALGGALTVSLVCGRRVDWDEALAELQDAGLAGGTVFFCGSKAMSEAVRDSSRRVGFAFRTESF